MSDRPRRRGNWSVQELERLRQLLPRRGVVETARLLRRAPSSIAKKALEILRVPPRRGAWTDAEDRRLREAWGAVEPRLLAPMLGRPTAEVLRRAAELRTARHGGPWSRAELQALKEVYGTRADDDLAVTLQRDREAIDAMAQQLSLAKDKRFAATAAKGAPGATGELPSASVRQPMPRWTDDEIVRLREIYADRDNLAVARMLGRTVTSVANKANQLGLKKSRRLLADIGRTNVAVRYGREAADGAAG